MDIPHVDLRLRCDPLLALGPAPQRVTTAGGNATTGSTQSMTLQPRRLSPASKGRRLVTGCWRSQSRAVPIGMPVCRQTWPLSRRRPLDDRAGELTHMGSIGGVQAPAPAPALGTSTSTWPSTLSPVSATLTDVVARYPLTGRPSAAGAAAPARGSLARRRHEAFQATRCWRGDRVRADRRARCDTRPRRAASRRGCRTARRSRCGPIGWS